MSPTALRKLAKAARNWEPTWRYLYNLHPTMQYRLAGDAVQGESARVLAALNRDGVAVTSVDRLLGGDSCFGELLAEVAAIEARLAGDIEAARAAARAPAMGTEKRFIVNLLGERPPLDPQNVFVRFATERPILAIANAYMGMFTRLRHFNVWHTVTTHGAPTSSQLWHTDRDDLHYVVKVFVNLSAVDAGAGPFIYAPGTHAKGTVKQAPRSVSREGNTTRSTDEQMAEVVPRERWITSEGPPGTIVLADTRGYHKGGSAREHDRVLYTCMFTSPLARPTEDEELFVRVGRPLPSTNSAQAFALGAAR